MIDARWLQKSTWLEGAWCDDWVREIPDPYWEAMLRSALSDFATWIPTDRWEDYLASETGRRQISEQLFVRLSQASANFVPWLAEHRDLDGVSVLEIGCGAGSSTAALARAGARVTGIDISDGYLRLNRTRIDALGLSADLHLVPMDWLSSQAEAERHLAALQGGRTFEMVVCYALLEHLLPAERLALLGALRFWLQAVPDACLVIYETPNRLAPYDWHSTHTSFPDILPDELAQAYLAKRLAPDHPWRAKLDLMLTGPGREDWFRGGRGASFHEFDVAFGLENLAVVQDGYSLRCDYIRHFRPDAAYEAALAATLARLDPPVPRGFCRPTLDVVLQWRGPAAPAFAAAATGAETSATQADSARVFGAFYREGWWGSGESRSGRGSELATTTVFRAAFEAWLAKHTDVVSILDAPCGDFNWMDVMRWPHPVRYLGGEVVAELVDNLTLRHAGPDRAFRLLDIIADQAPQADLWLCRDAMIHFPFALGARVVANAVASGTRYFLSTTFPNAANDIDCPLGGYHKVNLALPPFGLGPPQTLLPDPAENNQTDRFIGVWQLQDPVRPPPES